MYETLELVILWGGIMMMQITFYVQRSLLKYLQVKGPSGAAAMHIQNVNYWI